MEEKVGYKVTIRSELFSFAGVLHALLIDIGPIMMPSRFHSGRVPMAPTLTPSIKTLGQQARVQSRPWAKLSSHA